MKNDPLLIYAFGYGRRSVCALFSRRHGCQPFLVRVCPGRHLVDSTLWILVVSVLTVFNVRKKIDLDGKEIPVEGVYKDGLIS